LGEEPSATTKQRFEDALAAGKTSFGPALTQGLSDDPFCQRIMRVLGGMYGTYLRMLIATFAPTGGLHLTGSVNDTTTLLLTDPAYSPLIARLEDSRLPFAADAARVPIILNGDPDVMRRGAWALAGEAVGMR
jgi:hypothetical protein